MAHFFRKRDIKELKRNSDAEVTEEHPTKQQECEKEDNQPSRECHVVYFRKFGRRGSFHTFKTFCFYSNEESSRLI